MVGIPISIDRCDLGSKCQYSVVDRRNTDYNYFGTYLLRGSEALPNNVRGRLLRYGVR